MLQEVWWHNYCSLTICVILQEVGGNFRSAAISGSSDSGCESVTEKFRKIQILCWLFKMANGNRKHNIKQEIS